MAHPRTDAASAFPSWGAVLGTAFLEAYHPSSVSPHEDLEGPHCSLPTTSENYPLALHLPTQSLLKSNDSSRSLEK